MKSLLRWLIDHGRVDVRRDREGPRKRYVYELYGRDRGLLPDLGQCERLGVAYAPSPPEVVARHEALLLKERSRVKPRSGTIAPKQRALGGGKSTAAIVKTRTGQAVPALARSAPDADAVEEEEEEEKGGVAIQVLDEEEAAAAVAAVARGGRRATKRGAQV